MRQSLENLYRQYMDGYLQKIDYTQHKAAYPFLIYPSEHYMHASKRVMICGQETFGWGKEYPTPDDDIISNLFKTYHDFINRNGDAAKLKSKPGKGVSSPYWKFGWRLMKNNPDVGFVFQNVVKVGRYDKKGCDDEIFHLSLDSFRVWKEELKILKPDLIVFLTGDYDCRIDQEIGTFQKKSLWEGEFLDELIFKDPDMPMCIRTNHPQNLQMTKLRPNASYAFCDTNPSQKRFIPMADKISEIIQQL